MILQDDKRIDFPIAVLAVDAQPTSGHSSFNMAFETAEGRHGGILLWLVAPKNIVMALLHNSDLTDLANSLSENGRTSYLEYDVSCTS